MDPLTLGILFGMAASSAAAALGLRRRRRNAAGRALAAPLHRDRPASVGLDGARVGDVLTYLGEEYWLSGELTLTREGAVALRLFRAPERARQRWVAVPRDAQSLWVLEEDTALASIGWPGVEAPVGGRILRRTEHGNAAIVATGEDVSGWEGMGRYAMFRAHDGVALVVESASKRRVALQGREIPRQLVEKMG